MEIFITGATGYIGLAIAQAFRRAGYQVSGLARSASAAELLMRHEIAPVLGALETPERYTEAAARADVIVHAAVDYTVDTGARDAQAVHALLDVAASALRPKTFLYTSSTWVYGDTGGQVVDETRAPRPVGAVAWRPALERLVLDGANLRPLVIRPGVVYGGRGGLSGGWFAGARAGDLRIVGDGANQWAMVHVDDLADAYVRAADTATADGIFNLADHASTTVRELAQAAAMAAGYQSSISMLPLERAQTELGLVAEALSLSQQISSDRARQLLGWRPRHAGFVAEATTYYAAWRAALN